MKLGFTVDIPHDDGYRKFLTTTYILSYLKDDIASIVTSFDTVSCSHSKPSLPSIREIVNRVVAFLIRNSSNGYSYSFFVLLSIYLILLAEIRTKESNILSRGYRYKMNVNMPLSLKIESVSSRYVILFHPQLHAF